MSASNISQARIRLLPPVLVDRIAAGEVVDGPYSVVKELIENSIDSGARRLHIETVAAGMDRIVVSDNGTGISFDELPLSLERHATSKIESLEDIESIASFGFRGEALASISSVSHLTVVSTREGSTEGGRIVSRGGRIEQHERVAATEGTTVTVSELFYAVPARRKFARSERIENARIYREILKVAFAHPDLDLVYLRDGRELLRLRADEDLRERAAHVFRAGMEERLIAVSGTAGPFRLRGYVGDEHTHRTNRDGIFTYVNGRCVEIQNLPYLVRKAYGELLPHGAHPYAFLFLELDPRDVDVNVHPAKREVRFRDASALHSLVLRSVFEALRPGEPVAFPSSAARTAPASAERLPLSAMAPAPTSATLHETEAGPVLFSAPVGEPQGPFEIRGDADDRRVSRAFVPIRHFGVVFGTYILAEGEDGFYFIDQHTAHERVNYERVRARLGELKDRRQPLLEPIVVECLPDELTHVVEESARLLEAGFCVEEFGPRAYAIREVPAYLEPGTESEALAHVIQRLADGESVVRVYDDLAAMKACKASIKRNDHVSGPTITEILLQLAACEDPSRCPHGRPTLIRLSRSELDRMFHRTT